MKDFKKVFKELIIGFVLGSLGAMTLAFYFDIEYIYMCVCILIGSIILFILNKNKELSNTILISAIIFCPIITILVFTTTLRLPGSDNCRTYGVGYHAVKAKNNNQSKDYNWACCPEDINEVDENKCIVIPTNKKE